MSFEEESIEGALYDDDQQGGEIVKQTTTTTSTTKKRDSKGPKVVATKKRKIETGGEEVETNDAFDLVWSYRNGTIGNPGECTLLLQIDAEDATNLDIEGSSGAIGRIEVDSDGGECLCF